MRRWHCARAVFYVDATFGRGGHTARILEALGREGRVVAIDRDPRPSRPGARALRTKLRLRSCTRRSPTLRRSCRATAAAARAMACCSISASSSPQLDDAARGFSFRKDGPLDMRMDPTRGEPVSAWLARAGVDEIRHVIATFGEERFAGRVAAAIVRARAARSR